MLMLVNGFLPVFSRTIFLQFCLIVSIKFFSCLKLFTAKLLQVFVISSSKSNLKVSLASSSGIPRNETIGFLLFHCLKLSMLFLKVRSQKYFFSL